MGRTRESDDPYYDLFDDFELIVSSFQTQYGLRLSHVIRGMKWNEFATLLSGLNSKTPLGEIVAIRAEEDKNVLKTFSPAQRKIRSDYRNKRAKKVSTEKTNEALEQIKQAFMQIARG